MKDPVLGALPTLKLAPGILEARDAKRYVVDPLARISLDIKLKYPIETPIEILLQTQRSIKQYFVSEEQEKKER